MDWTNSDAEGVFGGVSGGEADTRSERKIVCVDVDEVIADALGEQLRRYNREFEERLTATDLHGHWIWDFVPSDRLPIVQRHIYAEDFFSNLAVMPHSQSTLKRMQEHYEVYIATAAMEIPVSFNAKYQWLKKHFPFIPSSHLVFCGDKSILRGDVLINDNPRQLRLFHGERILYSSPANLAVSDFRRVDSWLEIEQLFLGGTAPSPDASSDADPLGKQSENELYK